MISRTRVSLLGKETEEKQDPALNSPNSGSGSRQKFRIHADPDSTYCCKFKVPVPTDIFPKTNWRILQIIVCGFISMFVHHNLARNSIIIINFQKTSFRLLFFGFDILYLQKNCIT